MNEYQGLNLPQLMELLQPMVAPEPVSLWPQTPGWWVLLGWLLLLALLLTRRWRRRRLANRYRREAERQLDEVAAIGNPSERAAAIAGIVKRAALAAYPRERVAALTGSEWAAFLVRTASDDALLARHADQLANASYLPGVDPDELLEPARRWIRRHHV